jgi:hypothetical protein
MGRVRLEKGWNARPGHPLLIPPGKTELRTLNVLLGKVGWTMRFSEAVSRSSNSTSDGELTRVGTFGVEKNGGPLVRLTSESAAKTR